MILKKYAVTAALLAVLLMTGALFSGCGDGGSVPVSNAHSGAQQPSGSDAANGDSASHVADQPGDSGADRENASETDADAGNNGSNGSSGANGAGSGAGGQSSGDSPGSAGAAGSGSGSSHSSDADDSYFDDAVFIGDSLTEGFQLHGGITNATYYGFKNLNVKEVFEKPLVKSGSGKVTIADALRKNDFGKYYIMLGANELGWVYPEVFTKKYGELIDLIKEKNKNATIYLQSVLPVSEETSRTNKYYSNDRINYYDELISALADEKDGTYLNVRESVQNENGVLPDDAATDGVHLNKDYCRKWADYLREHN